MFFTAVQWGRYCTSRSRDTISSSGRKGSLVSGSLTHERAEHCRVFSGRNLVVCANMYLVYLRMIICTYGINTDVNTYIYSLTVDEPRYMSSTCRCTASGFVARSSRRSGCASATPGGGVKIGRSAS